MGGGGRGDLLAVTGDHRLVCGHHRLAGGDCLQDQGASRLQAAHHLHHDLDGRVFDHCPGIRGQQVACQRHRPRTGQVAHRHPAQGQLCQQRMAPLRARQDGRHACPHRAEPEQADADGHALGDCGTAILEIRCTEGVNPRCQAAVSARQALGLGLHLQQDVEEAVCPRRRQAGLQAGGGDEGRIDSCRLLWRQPL